MKYTSTYKSPLGQISMASDGVSLTGLWFEGQNLEKKGLDKNFEEKDLEIFDQTKAWLDQYFKGEEPDFDLKVSYQVSDFRREVLKILQKIPYGKTLTYGDIAKEIAQKRKIKTMSAQAVGTAVGHNPISIIIPCHRVIGAHQGLGGYGGGIERKIKLLNLEGIDTSKLKRKK